MKRIRKPLVGLHPGRVARPVAAMIATAAIVMTPLSALAEEGDSIWPDSEEVNDFFVSAVDIAVLRPGGLARIVVGGVLLVPSTLFNVMGLPFGRDTSVFKDDVDRFVMEPVEYTFMRPVGVDLVGS
ncbi:MAG: hypothetical protein JRG90_22600 [Deltaproteobacteria bacterium]|nr:hypothetical protein [Deltaproteobacteria bacterium]